MVLSRAESTCDLISENYQNEWRLLVRAASCQIIFKKCQLFTVIWLIYLLHGAWEPVSVNLVLEMRRHTVQVHNPMFKFWWAIPPYNLGEKQRTHCLLMCDKTHVAICVAKLLNQLRHALNSHHNFWQVFKAKKKNYL